jgi:hypothetical protein
MWTDEASQPEAIPLAGFQSSPQRSPDRNSRRGPRLDRKESLPQTELSCRLLIEEDVSAMQVLRALHYYLGVDPLASFSQRGWKSHPCQTCVFHADRLFGSSSGET